jgi:hypothetical protein
MASVAERRRAAAGLERGHRLWRGWGNDRDDARDYARLAARMKIGMQPVRPLERPVPRVPGQLRLF